MTDFTELSKTLFKANLQTELKTQLPKFRTPIHVVYGGADRFSAQTPDKFGTLAIASLEQYAPNFAEFANAFWLKGCETLPTYRELINDLEFQIADDPEKLKILNYPAWFAWMIHNRVIEKLKREPVEDFRIDFEDGYGIRSDEEEDSHAIQASNELAIAHQSLAFSGFRIKSFQAETYYRAVRTLELFISNLLKQSNGFIPENFAVTLPKITKTAEVNVLCELLNSIEIANNLPENSINIELMIETPESILLMREMVVAGGGRCVAAHFGAYDYTASFGITAVHQHLRHDACNFARNMMQISLAPLGIRVSDSVTTLMPVPIHKGENLSASQIAENKAAVHQGWRLHFNNVTHSLINGFYQSWDLHPAQLVARYAAVYSFFLESFAEQANRLKGFMAKATKATMSGNQFDDAASAEGLSNYFLRGISCGALTETEVLQETGLTADDLAAGSFTKMMESRLH